MEYNNTAVKKGIEAFGSYIPPRVEEKASPTIEGGNDFASLFTKHEQFFNPSTRFDEYKQIEEAFSPQELNGILTQLSLMQPKLAKGTFFSQLIQNSYDAGFNNFYFTTLGLDEVDYLVSRVHGIKGRELDVIIEGDVGHGCGMTSSFLSLLVKGNTRDNFGYESVNSSFTVQGNTEDWSGSHMIKSTLTVEGSVGDLSGSYSRYSVFTFLGDSPASFAYNAKSCIFRSSEVDVLIKMNTLNDPEFGSGGNTAIQIHPDGTEELIHGRFNLFDKLLWRLRKCPSLE